MYVYVLYVFVKYFDDVILVWFHDFDLSDTQLTCTAGQHKPIYCSFFGCQKKYPVLTFLFLLYDYSGCCANMVLYIYTAVLTSS